MSKLDKKRKVDLEYRAFKAEWSLKYFVIELNDKVTCLLCNDTIAVRKEYNIRRHYETKHATQYSKLTENERSLKLESLKRNLSLQQNCFVKIKNDNEAVTKTSLRIAHLLAQKGKPFTDGELIKSCLLVAAEEICPEKKDLFQSVSLSARTTVRRIEDIGEQIKTQLKEKAKNFKWFSLALDESTDINDTAQLLVFIRGVNTEFEVTEELASMNSLHGTTTGEDIFKEVEKTLTQYNLKWNQLKCVTTDGAKNMCGTGKGLVGQIFKACEEAKCTKPLVIHCIIHQQVLCGKHLNLSCVIEVVVSVVNFIRSRGLNHRQFREFLLEIEAEYPDLPYHTEIRWLSNGKVLSRFFELRNVIEIFLNEKNYVQPLLSNNEWLWKLAFATDIVGYLNEFNLKLQGNTVLICEMYSIVKSYRQKFSLFETQITLNKFDHFPCCKKFQTIAKSPFPKKFAADIFFKLKLQLEQRFSDLDANAKEISIFQNPFECTIDELPSELQLEVIDLQNDDTLKTKFKGMDLTQFYEYLSENEYGQLKSYARGFISVFGSTYQCEKTFSKMKYTKSQYRSLLTDDHLQTTLIIGSTNFVPNYDEIISQKKTITFITLMQNLLYIHVIINTYFVIANILRIKNL